LVTGGNRNHYQIFVLDLAADEVVLDLDVLGAVVEFWIIHHADGTVIVTVKRRRSRLTASNLMYDFSEPDVVSGRVSGGVVLRFCSGLGYWLLEPRFPGYWPFV
jgi:hypothetical protein